MNILEQLLTPREGIYFRSTFKDLYWFGKHVGATKLFDQGIQLQNYPHQACPYGPKGFIPSNRIRSIFTGSLRLSIRVEEEIIFMDSSFQDRLEIFAEMNNIPTEIRNCNWEYLTEPFLDLEKNDSEKRETLEILQGRGFTLSEILDIRVRIERQMMKYNFDTQLLRNDVLDLHDVLLAMRPSMKKRDFESFYWKAMEIETRAK